jgi:hypothetical protein
MQGGAADDAGECLPGVVRGGFGAVQNAGVLRYAQNDTRHLSGV